MDNGSDQPAPLGGGDRNLREVSSYRLASPYVLIVLILAYFLRIVKNFFVKSQVIKGLASLEPSVTGLKSSASRLVKPLTPSLKSPLRYKPSSLRVNTTNRKIQYLRYFPISFARYPEFDKFSLPILIPDDSSAWLLL